jgi:hypothetical protein
MARHERLDPGRAGTLFYFPLSPASAELNLHACADVDGHQLPISFPAALDNHHGFLWPVCDLSLERNIRDRTIPAELVDLNRILLTLARSRELPDGSSRHGYDFIAPLDPEGHIDPILWRKYRDYCRVRRFWAGEDDEVGRLVHKPGGAKHAR